MIPHSFIQDLLNRVDIVEVIQNYVQMKSSGSNLFGLCPFHKEHSPSFTVSPTKQFYYCFGCGAHGNVLKFLMDYRGIGYVEAIKDLSARLGLAVPDTTQKEPESRHVLEIIEILNIAAQFYVSQLKKNSLGYQYLQSRGLTNSIIERFGIGYAPKNWRNLAEVISDYDSDIALRESGLVIETSKPNGDVRRYDRFRGRVVFPIRSAQGKIIGFGGRIITQSTSAASGWSPESHILNEKTAGPKYLNSPETPVFSKSDILYGLFEAAKSIRTVGWVIVVEGYLDVFTLVQNGVDNVVATLGTAVTNTHLKILFRLVKRVVFAFDGDSAGRTAAWRAINVALPILSDGQSLSFLYLPDAQDPDSWVRKNGGKAFLEECSKAQSLSETFFGQLTQGLDLKTPEGRVELLLKARPLLSVLNESALGIRMQWVLHLSSLASISPEQAEKYLFSPKEANQILFEASGKDDSVSSVYYADKPKHVQKQNPDYFSSISENFVSVSERKKKRLGGRYISDIGTSEKLKFSGFIQSGSILERLISHIRLLSALHPDLTSEIRLEHLEGLPDDVTQELARWFASISDLEGLNTSPLLRAEQVAKQLQVSQATSSQKLLKDLQDSACVGLLREEALLELLGTLTKLRKQCLSLEIEGLVSSGLRSEKERKKYQVLMELQKKI